MTGTRLMITRLRKLFYGTPGWDEHLIPGAKPVTPAYPVREIETGRRDRTEDGAPDALEYVDTRVELDADAPAGSPESRLKDPSSVQQVLVTWAASWPRPRSSGPGSAGRKMSDLPQEYYGPDPDGVREQRFTVSAALYAGAGAHVKGYVNPVGWFELATSMLSPGDDPLRPALLEEFLRQPAAKVAAEPAAAPQ